MDDRERIEQYYLHSETEKNEAAAQNLKDQRNQRIYDEIDALARSYNDEIQNVKKDAFVLLIQEYIRYEQAYHFDKDSICYKKYKKDNGWVENNEFAKMALNHINSFRVPTEKAKLDMFCRSLEENADFLKEVCSQKDNYFIKDAYRNIVKKTNEAYDICYKDYKRPAKGFELDEIDKISDLKKSGKPEALIEIADIYPKYTEIQKWGSQKGKAELNPVGQEILSVLNNFEAPTDKDNLTAFMQEVIAQKEHLKELSKAHRLLNFKGAFGSNNLYNYLIGKGDEVIKAYFKDETEGFIGERNGKKAQNQKLMLYGVIAVVVLIILLIFLF